MYVITSFFNFFKSISITFRDSYQTYSQRLKFGMTEIQCGQQKRDKRQIWKTKSLMTCRVNCHLSILILT
jgi:hypothetical protein